MLNIIIIFSLFDLFYFNNIPCLLSETSISSIISHLLSKLTAGAAVACPTNKEVPEIVVSEKFESETDLFDLMLHCLQASD